MVWSSLAGRKDRLLSRVCSNLHCSAGPENCDWDVVSGCQCERCGASSHMTRPADECRLTDSSFPRASLKAALQTSTKRL